MLSFNFSISNPWHKDEFKSLWTYERLVSKNKAVELQAYRYMYDLFSIMFNFTHREDHAGLKIELAFLGYSIIFNFYDTRHWDYNNYKWEDNEDH